MLAVGLVLFIVHILCLGSSCNNQEQLKSIVISRTIVKSYKLDIANDHKMIEQLNGYKKSEFIKKFIALDTRAKLLYLRSLDIEMYQAFLARFDCDESKWHALWQGCSQEDKKYLPSTLNEQYILVRDCYYQHCSMGFIQSMKSLIKEQRAKNPLMDLSVWKRMYHQTRGCTNDQELCLENEFQRRKYEMLKLEV